MASLRNILLKQTQILFIAGPVNHSNDAFQPLNPVPSSSTNEVIEHQMSLFAILLTSLFLFPGDAVAGIGAPSSQLPPGLGMGMHAVASTLHSELLSDLLASH